jgi:hypothetical protein
MHGFETLEPVAPAPPTPEPAIAMVAWPSEAERRARLADAGVPRLLFIAPGHAPPKLWDRHEDWVRVPASAEEVRLRAATLQGRLAAGTHPSS